MIVPQYFLAIIHFLSCTIVSFFPLSSVSSFASDPVNYTEQQRVARGSWSAMDRFTGVSFSHFLNVPREKVRESKKRCSSPLPLYSPNFFPFI